LKFEVPIFTFCYRYGPNLKNYSVNVIVNVNPLDFSSTPALYQSSAQDKDDRVR